MRARSHPFGLGAREGGAGDPPPAEASGAVLAQCVSRARVRRSLRPVRESPATPFLTEGALVHHDVVNAYRPIFNADGSLSEFPFVLTWFPIPEWDDSESDEENPSLAGAQSEEPESEDPSPAGAEPEEPESEDDREIPEDECW